MTSQGHGFTEGFSNKKQNLTSAHFLLIHQDSICVISLMGIHIHVEIKSFFKSHISKVFTKIVRVKLRT